jgi:ParB-like chromosome segregation protein Spo0J
MASNPPLKPLHPDTSLIQLKLNYFNRLPTEEIVLSLQVGQKDSLKARPDGTILDGHHRIAILRSRGVDVDVLPREIISKDSDRS